MKTQRWFVLLLMSLMFLQLSCREGDEDVKKDLDEQEDGTLEVNATDIEGLDYRETSDTLDQTQQLDGAGEGVYRQNNLPQEDIIDEDEEENTPE